MDFHVFGASMFAHIYNILGDAFSRPLPPFWFPFGSPWLPSGSLLSAFSSFFAPFGCLLVPLCFSRYSFGSFCVFLVHFGSAFGPPGVQIATKMWPMPWYRKAPKFISQTGSISGNILAYVFLSLWCSRIALGFFNRVPCWIKSPAVLLT